MSVQHLVPKGTDILLLALLLRGLADVYDELMLELETSILLNTFRLHAAASTKWIAVSVCDDDRLVTDPTPEDISESFWSIHTVRTGIEPV